MESTSNANILKVILLGDGRVGKTSLIQQYINKRFNPNPYHTIGVEFSTKVLEIDGRMYTIQLWDTAGQERYKTLRTPFYRGCDICIFTFDLCQAESFDSLQFWYDEFIRYSNVSNTQMFPFMVFGNKNDLPERSVSYEDVLNWCKEKSGSITAPSDEDNVQQQNIIDHGFPYIETSAKTAANVDDGFKTAIRLWAELDSKNTMKAAENYDLSGRINLDRARHKERTCC